MNQKTPDAPEADGADQNVVHLQQDWTALRGATPLAQVEAYWYAVRGTRLVPRRADVDPRGIEGALSHAFIIERIAPGHARIRIAGTHVFDLLGMEVRGMPLSALFEPGARSGLQTCLRGLFDGPAIQKLFLASEGRIGKPALSGQMSLYPLRNDKGEIARALGCLVTDGKPGRAPRRFDLVQTRRTMLQAEATEASVTGETADRSFDEAGPAPVVAAAEPSTAFRNTAVPWLRVVGDAQDDAR